jgi:hypothetical protein
MTCKSEENSFKIRIERVRDALVLKNVLLVKTEGRP